MKTRKFCPHCERPLLKSNVRGYAFQCCACNEDFYRFEVINLRNVKLAHTIREVEYLDGLARGEFMPHSFNKPYPCRKPAPKATRRKYVILQPPDAPEYCDNKETLFESIEIRTETENSVLNFGDLYREIGIYNQQNPQYKFTIKQIKCYKKSRKDGKRNLRGAARHSRRPQKE